MCERETERRRERERERESGGDYTRSDETTGAELKLYPRSTAVRTECKPCMQTEQYLCLSIRVVLMCVGDRRDTGSRMYVCFYAVVIYSEVQDLVCVKPSGIQGLQRGLL